MRGPKRAPLNRMACFYIMAQNFARGPGMQQGTDDKTAMWPYATLLWIGLLVITVIIIIITNTQTKYYPCVRDRNGHILGTVGPN